MSSLVPSEVSLLQKISVNKLLENFSYDLIFPMELPTDPGSTETIRGKLPPLRTSFAFDELNQFDIDSSSTPSSVQSDYFSFPGGGGGGSKAQSNSHNNNWYSSRPNISQPENFQDTSLLFSPPKRYLSDSNLTNYQFGSGTGDTSPMDNSSMYGQQQQQLSSPFKGDAMNKANERNSDYEPFHTRSSFNLNFNGNSITPAVQKVDKATMYSADIMNNLDSYASNMKGLEQTMRLLQSQHHQQQHISGNYLERSRQKQLQQQQQHSSLQNHHHHFRQTSNFGSTNFSRQTSTTSSDDTMDFRQTSFPNLNHHSRHISTATTNTSGGNSSNFSSCSSIDMNGHASPVCSANSVRTWNGVIPTRTSKAVTYSQKVFLGGIPWETSEDTLKHIFGRFGPLRVEWPGKDPNFSTKPKGCVYIIFEHEKQVRELLAACQLVRDRHVAADEGKFFYKFPWKNMKTKNVEVIPWNIADSNYVSSSQILDPSKTIFVGALHGKLTAEGLALIMNDLFEGVVYAGIDTDKHKYPLGAGRVTFNNPQSYMKAIQTGYLLIKTPIFTKKVQIDPYLEDNLCSTCNIHHGPYYCRELSCFRYFCRVCWQLQHSDAQRAHHRPLTRNSKSQSIVFND